MKWFSFVLFTATLSEITCIICLDLIFLQFLQLKDIVQES